MQADAVETLLYFREGTLVFAEAGSLGETLGRLSSCSRLLARRRVAQGPPGSTPLPPTREKHSGAEVDRLIEDAVVARTAGKAAAAVALLRRARGAQPGHPVVLAELALALLVQDAKAHSREANALAREARRADPSLPLPYVVLGRLLESVGERDRARQLYVHALTLDPECVEAQEAVENLERE